ncbi:hypothetical protein SAMN05216389_10316 [Oceanobacillus limi]|uniref:Uncharacterized protein n=1 Tax=Oceanobacillus limi TaxID=930131 RepID=A0A1I0A182_9BACI|nr:hypothetical protein [Oceanobacillus limi]SES87701.1 hypothetical protein SAMN05216389_10316 [Oceanobacillus limi]
MSPYVFVLAAVLAVIPILFFYKINLEKLKENPTLKEKYQTNLFIGVGISEAIPIILIVFGMANMETVGSFDELLIPGMIVILIMAIGSFFVLLQRSVDVTKENKEAVNTFSFVSLALMNAIPIISIVSLFMMAP